MTPHVAARLTIHEPDAVTTRVKARSLRSVPLGPAPDLSGPAVDARRNDAVLWREAVQRRLLAAGDVLAAVLALGLMLALAGAGQATALVLTAMPLIVVVFKLGGLYDRDQLR